jgi:hypothetical protein
MAAHTPKGEAIEKFVHHEASSAKDWIIRMEEEPDNPAVMLRAQRDDQADAERLKSLEVHTRQVRLQDDELDESTKTMIRRWMHSL